MSDPSNTPGTPKHVTGGAMATARPRPGYTQAPAGTPRRPTGAKPTPKNRLRAAPKFTPAGPPPAAWIWLPSRLSYWGNQQYGDCVSAEEAFNQACGGKFIHDSTVISWAKQHGWLNGAYLDEVLDAMKQSGFPQEGNVYGVGGKATVDYTQPALLAAAIFAGPVKIGVASGALQNVVGSANGWFLDGAHQDQNEDHSVTLCGYGTAAEIAKWLNVTVPSGIDPNKPGYALFTWDTVGWISAPSMIAITAEAWTRTPGWTQTGTNPPDPDDVFTPEPAPPPPPPPPPPGGLSMTLPEVLGPGTFTLTPAGAMIEIPLDIPAGSYVATPVAGEGAGAALGCFVTLVLSLLSGVPFSQALAALIACLQQSGDPAAAEMLPRLMAAVEAYPAGAGKAKE